MIGVDAGRVAAGAAGRNGGFLIGGPEASLHEAIDALGPGAAVGLYRQTLAELDRWTAELGPTWCARSVRSGWPGCPATRRTTPRRPTAPRELADCAQQAAAMRAHGIAVEDYDGPLGQRAVPARRRRGRIRRAARVELADRARPPRALHEHTR